MQTVTFVCLFVDLNGSVPSDSAHLFNPLEWGRSNSNNEPSPSAGDGLPQPHGDGAPRSAVTLHFSGPDRNSVYARVSKKLRLTDSPVHSSEVKQEEQEEAGGQEEEAPPLPDRKLEMDEWWKTNMEGEDEEFWQKQVVRKRRTQEEQETDLHNKSFSDEVLIQVNEGIMKCDGRRAHQEEQQQVKLTNAPVCRETDDDDDEETRTLGEQQQEQEQNSMER